MGPNDAELVRVFTAQVGGIIADVTFPVNTDFEVRVDAEAGSAIFASGAAFQTNIVLRDITANNDIPFAPAAGFSGTLNSAAFANAAKTFTYAVAAAGLAGRENHLCEARGFLNIGVTNQDSSFAVSPTFLLTAP